jgi:hypothetical protein
MLLRQVWLLAVAVGVTGQVFAQEVSPAKPVAPQAATPAPPPADAKPVNAEAAKPAAAAASSETAPASSPLEGEIDADKIMAMQRAGYQIKNENGKILLCHQDQQTGSRLRKKTSCMTAREWEQLQEENKMQLKSLERRPRMSPQ